MRAGSLMVAGVKRALSKLGARRHDGPGHRVVAAPPRGHETRQLALPIIRAESKRGASCWETAWGDSLGRVPREAAGCVALLNVLPELVGRGIIALCSSVPEPLRGKA